MATDFVLTGVRAHFGLSQPQLAPWLGISKSQLARVEAGYDPLPRRAIRWLAPWLTAMNLAAAAAAAEDPGPPRPPRGRRRCWPA